ncbi:OB-fold nucleic acid binding domain-containing protein [Nocardioides sp. Y6]|uniref:OB-fold nucleic acid binding domain-containing protein n=1 Tax=Nocardioides malaquae TaxID=2773426 RepID=A0ABR9RNI0_9ACTN|nr:OB-fold nucleic acid binding domain-containing protein [Nocardioides malaquae]MBE7323126.1 OB-fold nucleic acid binding domain-containing protein [Nocardioides malaquae]
MSVRGSVRQALSRWADTADQEQRDLRRTHGSAGELAIAEAPLRTPVTLQGTLRSVTLMPRGGVPTLEAELDDGTATVTLVWLGRRRLAGIEAGRALSASGRIGLHDGRRILYNPRYELMP